MKDLVKKRIITNEDKDQMMDVLMNAGEIIRDKELMKNLKEHARVRKGQLTTLADDISSIDDLRKLSNAMYDQKAAAPQKASGKKSKVKKKNPKTVDDLREISKEYDDDDGQDERESSGS